MSPRPISGRSVTGGARSVSDPVGDRSRKGSYSRRHRRNPVLPGPVGRSNPEPGTRSLPGPNPGNGQNQPRKRCARGSGNWRNSGLKKCEKSIPRRDTKALKENLEGSAKDRERGRSKDPPGTRASRPHIDPPGTRASRPHIDPPGTRASRPHIDLAREENPLKGGLGAPCRGVALDGRLFAGIRMRAGRPRSRERGRLART